MENGADPYVTIPESHGGWTHIGHTITMNTSTNNLTNKNVICVDVRAYKFDSKRRSGSKSKSGMMPNKKKVSGKQEHSIDSYVEVLENIKKSKWVKHFVGEEGKGINGSNNESRFVV